MTPLRSLLPFGREPAGSSGMGGGMGMMDLGALHREVDRLFDDMVRGWPAIPTIPGMMGSGALHTALAPRIDIRDTGTALEVRADLPGVEDKDIDVRMVDTRTLTIRAQRTVEEDKTEEGQAGEGKTGNGWHVHERSHTAFLRTIPLPCDIDPETVEAVYDKGVLTLTLGKAPEAEQTARRIEVKTAQTPTS